MMATKHVLRMLALMASLEVVVAQQECTPQPINAHFILDNATANNITSTVIAVALLLPKDTNISIHVITNKSVYTHGPYPLHKSFQDLYRLNYSRGTHLEQHVREVSDNNNGKGAADINFIFGKTACETSVWPKRITYVVVTSNLSKCTDLASDDQHIVQIPLTGAHKKDFLEVLCSDTYRLCDTDHFLQGRHCTPCQDVCVNIKLDNNRKHCQDVCKYYNIPHSSTAASTEPTPTKSAGIQIDSKYIVVIALVVILVVLIITICLIRRMRRLRRNAKDNALMSFNSLDQTHLSQQETVAHDETKMKSIPGEDTVIGRPRETNSDEGMESEAEAEKNDQSSLLLDRFDIPDNPASNAAVLKIATQNDAIAGEKMHNLRGFGRLSEP